GGLYALIDRTALAPQARPAEKATGQTRVDHGARWWLLAVSGMLLVAVFAQGTVDPLIRLLVALLAPQVRSAAPSPGRDGTPRRPLCAHRPYGSGSAGAPGREGDGPDARRPRRT
ncbi:hypothetical protein CTI14_54405, partial [Methylobacterium radiotolerans]